jgi:peptidoglycan/xylan/chitin deacetylase (PgdA/CDA1 family)
VNEGWTKRSVFKALDALGGNRLAVRLATGVPVLAYHGVTSRPDSLLVNRRRLHVPVETFARHLELIWRDWHPISLDTLLSCLRGSARLCPRAVLVTFDDGYRNVRTVAAPLLRRFGIPFTLFVLTGCLGRRLWIDRLEAAIETTDQSGVSWNGLELSLSTEAERVRTTELLVRILSPLGPARTAALAELLDCLGGDAAAPDEDRDLLTWEEVRDLRDAGATIGSHADIHEPLTDRPPEEVRLALQESLATLTARLGQSSYAFCYPYGAWDSVAAESVRAAGFEAGFTTEPGRNRAGSDLYSLRRCLVGADDDNVRLRASLSGLRALLQRGA